MKGYNQMYLLMTIVLSYGDIYGSGIESKERSSPFIKKENAVFYLKRSKRSYKDLASINEECREDNCDHEEVQEWCEDGCFEEHKGGKEGRDYCQEAPADECVCTYFFRRACACDPGYYCSTSPAYCTEDTTRDNVKTDCFKCPSQTPIDNCMEQSTNCHDEICLKCNAGYYRNNNNNCSACPSIPNCQSVVCSERSDTTCTKCINTDLYQLDNTNKECSRKCSWENRWCWPGTCNDYARNCVCDHGFRRNDTSNTMTCQLDSANTNHKPEILDCSVNVYSVRGERKPEGGGSSKCSEQMDFYGNFQVDHVTSKTAFEFQLNITTRDPPAWVEGFAFGITDASIILYKEKKYYGFTLKFGNSTRIIKSDPNGDDPKSLYTPKIINITNTNYLINGDSLCFRFFARAGGHIVSKNVQTHATSNVPYQKTETFRDLCYIYDDDSPTHCSETKKCADEPLVLSERRLRTLDLTASFNGWLDPIPAGTTSKYASQIEKYKITVYETKELNSTHLEVGRSPAVNPLPVNSSITSMDLTLPKTNHPVLYAIVLEVKDTADNIRQSRRFALFDNSSSIKSNDDMPFLVTSANNNTNHKWQNHYRELCYSWKERFYNDKYVHTNLLKPIVPDHHGLIQGSYDQISGLLPVNGTSNVHGITEFVYTLLKNTSVLESNETLSNLTSQNICLFPAMEDGDTFWLILTSIDIMENTFEDRIDVYIDASGPEITNIWLIKDGIQRLFVHNSTDLSKMVVEFEVFDSHSGIYSVHWGVGTSHGGMELGHGSLGVIKMPINESCAMIVNCYCPIVGQCEYSNYTLTLNSLVHNDTHIGNHNRDYFLTIQAINVAQLVSTEHIDILVDNSPPEPGVVQEGPVDSPDADYTSDKQVIVHWHGFFDHESGIKLYRTGIDKTCLTREKVESRHKKQHTSVNETTETSTVLPLDSIGRHFVTVLAYNNAMEPSMPVCSDGIVYDKTPPMVSKISLVNARVGESVACSSGTAWLINHNATKSQLAYVKSCVDRCRGSPEDPFIVILPEQKLNSTMDSDIICDRMESFDNKPIYIPTDLIELKWNIYDDFSQIRNVYVGFGTSKSNKYLPDIVGYRESKHKLWFRDRHSSLSSGTKMYAFIRAVNKAGLANIIPYGPIIIDETPPVCPSSVPVEMNDTDIILKWDKNMFFDPDQEEEMHSMWFQIGNSHGQVTSFLDWKRTISPKCVNTIDHCITYPIKRLQLVDTELGLPFTIKVHAYNLAGYHCTVTSKSFILPSLYPPGHGIVLDIDPNAENDKIQDVDFIPSSKKLCAAWTGFRHHQAVTFMFGVGLEKGRDDVVAFHPIGSTESHCLISNDFLPFQNYYVTVMAKCSGGMTNSSSDGITIIDKDYVLSTFKVYDGPRCSDKSKVAEIKINSAITNTSAFLFDIEETLHIGKVYTFELIPENPNISAQSQDFINLKRRFEYSGYQGTVIRNRPNITLYNSGDPTQIQYVIVYACENDVDYQTSTHSVDVHWSADTTYENYISHYLISLFLDGHENKSIDFVTNDNVKAVKSSHGSLKSLNLNTGFYKTFVQPCFGDLCLEGVESNGFTVERHKPITGAIKATMTSTGEDCQEFSIEFDPFVCSTGKTHTIPSFYRWAIFRHTDTDKEEYLLSSWTEVFSSQASTEQSTNCLKLPSYPHTDVYVHVEGFCRSGVSSSNKVLVDIDPDPNVFSKMTLYDVDANSAIAKANGVFLGSTNIGNKLKDLHRNEIDFAKPYVTLGGIIPGVSARSVTWYLMKTQNIPSGYCFSEKDCIVSFETSNGFAAFKHIELEHNKMYYICATSNETVIERELFTETLDTFSVCSDGVFIDDTKPSHGTVEIINSGGYITDRSEITLQWRNFNDSEKYTAMGYPSDIKKYMYTIGSHPYGKDVVYFTDVGLSKGVIQRNLSLQLGKTYYASVTAINHVGLSATSVSDGVIFDNTPPKMGMIHVGGVPQHKYVFAKDLYVHWMNFQDKESGISEFEVGIGSSIHSPDIVPFQTVRGDYTSISQTRLFHDGHRYFAFLKTTNGAGISSASVSQSFVIDNSPPTPGVVRDGPSQSQSELDYQLETMTLDCHWTDFDDPHSHILYYKVGLGTEPGETDVFPLYNVDLKKDMTWKSHFEPGQRYYVTVEACNGANLCTRASSNGIIMENSPPITGSVHVGLTGMHSKYISHADSLQAQWFGFQDPESDLHHFEVCVGKAAEQCDIKSFIDLHLFLSVTLSQLFMPVGINLFVTVRAYNNAGLYADKSSDAFIVDDTPPVNAMAPEFDLNGKHVSNNFVIQWDVSLLKSKWKFRDENSPIIRQTVSIFTHHDGHTAVENVELTSENHLTIALEPKEWLYSGDKYYINVTACNAALLCTIASSNALLIDSTPPHLGSFKDALTWSSVSVPTLHLKWHGFVDVESGINQYKIAVGKSYSGSDLSGGFISFPHIGEASADQEGEVHLSQPLSVGHRLFLSIWAENDAGLISRIVKIKTEVVASDISLSKGKLVKLKHSCNAEYCTKDCTCAEIGKKCAEITMNASCIESSNLPIPNVSVFIGTNQIQTYTSSSACLSAYWTLTNAPSNKILRYEWSFGVDGMNVGVGIFDSIYESSWYDIEKQTNIAHCLPRGRELIHEDLYAAYVRAWISKTEYYIFKSAAVKVDQTPPSVRRGKFVKDSDPSCLEDIDYSSKTDSITGCWNLIFSEQQSNIVEYQAYLGTAPGADDVISIQSVGMNTRVTWKNLHLQQGTRYYITVKAINSVDLQVLTSSDGFVVDNRIPKNGVVYNTMRHKNVNFQSSTNVIGISWHGFEDSESHIRSYRIAIFQNDNSILKQNLNFRDVGIVNVIQLRGLELIHGKEYTAAVKAVDAAGHESEVSFSRSLLIDTTPPEPIGCNVFNQTLFTTFNGTGRSITWDETIYLVKDTDYKLTLTVLNVKTDIMATFVAKHLAVNLPFSQNADGSVWTEFEFLSPFEGSIPVSVTLNGEMSMSLIELELFVCTEITTNISDKNAVLVRQNSPNSVSVSIKVKDDDSGVRHVFVGAGTTPGGFQILPLSPSSLINQLVMDVNVTHGTPFYANIVVENNAGLRRSLSSKKLLIDHTPPVISEVKLEVAYVYIIEYIKIAENETVATGNGSLKFENTTISPENDTISAQNESDITNIQTTNSSIDYQPSTNHNESDVQYNNNGTRENETESIESQSETSTKSIRTIIELWWNAIDEETGIKICFFALGTLEGSANIQEWTEAIENGHFRSDALKLNHGEEVYPTVQCINNIDLTKTVHGNPKTVVIRSPEVSSTTVDHLTRSRECASSTHLQRNDSTLQFFWSGMTDVTGISSYECAIYSNITTLVDWVDIGKRTFIESSDLELKNDQNYTTAVRANNRRNIYSHAVESSIVIKTEAPKLIGLVKAEKVTDTTVSIQWFDAFDIDDSLFLHYILTVGTHPGYGDLVRLEILREQEYTAGITSDITEIYVTVTAVYCTGNKETIRQNIQV